MFGGDAVLPLGDAVLPSIKRVSCRGGKKRNKKERRFLKYSLLLRSGVMEAAPDNDWAAVEPLLETSAMELNNSDGGAVSEDFPAASADMQGRDDSDLSASVLQKISDIVARQVSLAMNSTQRAPVPVTLTEATTTATATKASASQAQTVCLPQTQCPPVTSVFVALSAGG